MTAARGLLTSSMCVGIALCGLPGGADARSGSPHATSVEEIRGVLRAHEEDARTRKQVVAELVALGPRSIPDLFDTYTGVTIEELLGEDRVQVSDWWCSPDDFGEVALEALVAHPPKMVVAALTERMNDSTPAEIRLAAVRALGTLQSSEGLPVLFAAARDQGPRALQLRSVQTTFEAALARILATDPASFAVLQRSIGDVPPWLLQPTIEAARETASPEGARFLLALLGRDPALDIAALEASADLAHRFPWRLRSDPRRHVRERMSAADAGVRRAAAVAAGRIRDIDALGELIALLDDVDVDVRRSAEWALGSITGQDQLETADEWTRWYEIETSWWSTEGARLREELHKDDPRRVCAAARSLARRPLHRDEVAAEIATILPDQAPAVVEELCGVLADLDSCFPVPVLADMLFDSNGRVRSAAGATLRVLTRQDLPAEPWIWAKYVNG